MAHACKLEKEGNRKLFNCGADINWGDNTEEGLLIREQGPVCAVFKREPLHDRDAACALSVDDILNANCQMGEDEMQAFGRVHVMMERLAM